MKTKALTQIPDNHGKGATSFTIARHEVQLSLAAHDAERALKWLRVARALVHESDRQIYHDLANRVQVLILEREG